MADYNSDRTGSNIDFTLDKVDALDAKVQPTATGANVTGTVTADGLSIGSTRGLMHIGTGNIEDDGNTIDFNGARPLSFSVSGSERARIDSSGNLLVGTTSQDIFGSSSQTGVVLNRTLYAAIQANNDGANAAIFNRLTSDGSIVQFRKDGVEVGSISVTGSATSYNTSSDERLKENIQDTTHSVDIDDIQVREFDWKVDGSHQRYGFIAQELETVYPEAVHSPEDADEMKSVDYSKLVPLLVKEIQQLKAEIKGLKA